MQPLLHNNSTKQETLNVLNMLCFLYNSILGFTPSLIHPYKTGYERHGFILQSTLTSNTIRLGGRII